MTMPPFNPSQHQYALLPIATNKPNLTGTMSGGTSGIGQSIGYLRAILAFHCGHPELTPLANWGPWTYAPCIQAIRDFQAFFGLNVTGSVSWAVSPNGASTWGMIDYICAVNS